MVHQTQSLTDTVTIPAGPEPCSTTLGGRLFFSPSPVPLASATGRAVSTTTAQGTPQTGRRPRKGKALPVEQRSSTLV